MRSALRYEGLLLRLRHLPGLYLVGAGASAGVAPLGTPFWRAAPLDFLRNLSGFSAQIPTHSELTEKIIKQCHDIEVSEIFSDQVIRPGTEVPPYREILKRIPNFYTRLLLKYMLAKANFSAIACDSYQVFQLFHPSLIANYNHDGLASRQCGHWHRILDMHGSVGKEFGSPQIEVILDQVRPYHLPEASDGILLGIQESWQDQALAMKLLEMSGFEPAFIAIIGYSFARNTEGYDDHVSLAFFEYRFQHFLGPIYVIDPAPGSLCEMLSRRLKLREIIGIPAWWNVLSHAFLKSFHPTCQRRSIDYIYEEVLDTHGSDIAFPPVRD